MMLMQTNRNLYLVIALCLILILLLQRFLDSPFVHHPKIQLAFEKMYGNVTINVGGGEKISLWNYPSMETCNEMTVSFFNNCASSIERRDSEDRDISGKFFVITVFAYLNPKNFQLNHLQVPDGLEASSKMIHARNLEIMNVLASNLKHPFIQEVHVMVKDSEAVDFLRHLPLENSFKVVIIVIEGPIEMNTQLEYAGRCLSGKIVAISNQDMLFGRGWEKLKPDILKQKRLMYALTRHTSKGWSCKATRESANCDPKNPYIGAHDVFMFHVKEKFSAEKLKPMDEVTPIQYGMENMLIWTFRHNLGYTVINPCPILIVHHQHCIAFRVIPKERKRVYGGGRSGTAGYTDKLE